MAQRIYMVVGETGEYAGYQEWMVVAYTDEGEAQKHVELAQKRADELANSMSYIYHHQKLNEWDQGMLMDYTGTLYKIESIDLVERVEEYKDAKDASKDL